MVALPQSPTIEKIYETYAARATQEPARDYLGGSELGQECSRRIWYSFRHVGREAIDGRIARLFQTGHLEEARLIQDLRDIGCEVLDKDPATGKQWRYVSGHLSGGLDGVVLGLPEAHKTWHLLEIKTANKKSFDKIEKDGVKKAKPEHYAQMQMYMGLAELTRAAYFVCCKDDDRIYLERVEFDPSEHKSLLLKANRIIKEESPPERISEDRASFGCKFCPMVDSCHGQKMPAVNCRTCVHSSATDDGKWACGRGLGMEAECNKHLYIPGLLHWAEPVGGDPTFVQYKIKHNGRQFVNAAADAFPGSDLPHYSSKELSKCAVGAIGEPAVEAARHVLGGEVVGSKAWAEDW